MSAQSDNFQQADVRRWAIVALACGAFAVLAANLSGLVPSGTVAGLHATRTDGGNVVALRAEVGSLKQAVADLRRSSDRLRARIELSDQARTLVIERVKAIELGMPALLDANDLSSPIDLDSVTAGIGRMAAVTRDAEGGSVSVTQRPLFGPATDRSAGAIATPQPLPARPSEVRPISLNSEPVTEFGIALGQDLAGADASERWGELNEKVGMLLIGLHPIIARGRAAGDSVRLVAGPLLNYSVAEELCRRVTRLGIDCLPVAFAGDPLPRDSEKLSSSAP